MRSGEQREESHLGHRRLIAGYATLAIVLGLALTISVSIGVGRDHAPAIAGTYRTDVGSCLDKSFPLEQSGEFVDVDGEHASATLRLRDGRLTGDVSCVDGGRGVADILVTEGDGKTKLAGEVVGSPFEATFVKELPEPGMARGKAQDWTSEQAFARFMLAIAAVILAARLLGGVAGRLGQPRVMGEVLAGILLGPTLLGAVAPGVQDYLFPPEVVPWLTAAAWIGLAFYLFIVGMELDAGIVRDRLAEAALISNTSVAFPLALGFLVALPLYTLLAPAAGYVPFALFIGVAMSITAFPVLARILLERRMLKRPIGALAMSAAAIDDVTAWGLLALATAVAGAGSGTRVLVVIGAGVAFTAALLIVGRRLLCRVSTAYDEVGRVPTLWLGVIFVSVLLATYVSGAIGIAPIYGAFLMGAIMPRHAGLTDDVRSRVEDFVVIVLLPLFFVITGLRTEIGALNRPELWAITLGLIAVAIIGKWVGAMAAARYSGFTWRESSVLGVLMNTRGLTELIVLNIGLELHLISAQLFTMLVVMALVTTFMAGPALHLLDRDRTLAAPADEELREAVRSRAPESRRAIVIAPQDSRNLDALLALGVPLARSEPPRGVIVARLLVSRHHATGPASDQPALDRAVEELRQRKVLLAGQGVDARTVAFTTPDPGEDLIRLAEDEPVDLLLLDGRRPLLGDGVPKGAVGRVLRDAACDVAVLVERERGIPRVDADHPVVVPFGGATHDWAALELGVWIATARQARLRLLGAAGGPTAEGRDASRLLASASLAVQQLTGLVPEPLLVRPGSDVIDHARDAGLLVVGLSERWREEGIGPLRAGLVKTPPVTTLLVRRGHRTGMLASRDDVTRFSWSIAAGSPGR